MPQSRDQIIKAPQYDFSQELQQYEDTEKHNIHYSPISKTDSIEKVRQSVSVKKRKQSYKRNTIQLQTSSNVTDSNQTDDANDNASVYDYSQFDDLDELLSDNDDISESQKAKDEELSRLRDKLKKKTALTEDLQKQVDKLRYEDDENNQRMRESIAELENILKENTQTKKELMAENKSLKHRIQNLEQQLEDKDGEIDKLNAKIDKNAALHTEKQGEYHFALQKAENEAESYLNDNKMISDENNRLNAEVSALRKYSRDMEQELNDITRDLRMSQNQLMTYQNQQKESQINRKSMVSQLSLFKAQNEELRKTLNEVNRTNESLTRKSRTSLMMLQKTRNDYNAVGKDFSHFYEILLTLKQNLDSKLEIIATNPNSEANTVSIDVQNDDDESQTKSKLSSTKDFVDETHTHSISIDKQSITAQFELVINDESKDGFIRSDTYNKCIILLNEIVAYLNESKKNVRKLKKQIAGIKKKTWNKRETFEILEKNFRQYQHLMDDKFALLSKEKIKVKKLEENMERYHEFIENLSANFSKYHELIEKKFGILYKNGIIGKMKLNKT